MKRCRACGAESVVELLELGKQPICNRFLSDPARDEYTHGLALDQCEACGLIQIGSAFPASELLPRFEWITYNEPEGHLDELVEIVCRLPGVTSRTAVCGLSFKDDSTLARLRTKGFQRTWRLDLGADLGVGDPRAGVETIQDRLVPGRAREVARRCGMADIVIARHILEHASDPGAFIAALKELLAPSGYLVFEVPDCRRALEALDYTTIWEEHSLYFTPQTFRHLLVDHGPAPVRFECYPYPFENSLVGIVQPRAAFASPCSVPEIVAKELGRGRRFAEAFPARRGQIRGFLAEFRRRGKIALFGAGHLAGMFVNVLGLAEYIDFVVDDNPHKRGLFMPGSRLPIYGSVALLEQAVTLCLLSVNPIAEESVIRKNRKFLERGGRFFSLFPMSQRALPIPTEV